MREPILTWLLNLESPPSTGYIFYSRATLGYSNRQMGRYRTQIQSTAKEPAKSRDGENKGPDTNNKDTSR